jgi:23S rRNA (cytosine1962-C5)-methyltransferase
MSGRVVLKPGREKSVLCRHPWVFSGAVQSIDGDIRDGGVTPVHAADGRFLAIGYLNRKSQIVLRLVSWQPNLAIDADFWRDRLMRSISRRLRLLETGVDTDAYRLVHAESDGLPGLIVDRYGDWLVMQILTLGMDRLRNQLADCLADLLPDVRGIYERSDVEVRRKEGLMLATGKLLGDAPPDEVVITENGLRFAVDLKGGQKTGFYLDQRENREHLECYARGADVLNCFAYTGAFGIYAARGGARQVTSVEALPAAAAVATRNRELNGLGNSEPEWVVGDVFQQLRHYRDAARQFDLIVLDPPKFASSKSGVERAARAYKDINWLAMRLLRPGGHLFTFSCSGSVSTDLFQKILFAAALDSEREVQIIGWMAQGGDHPVSLTFPEAAYLKGVICRVD